MPTRRSTPDGRRPGSGWTAARSRGRPNLADDPLRRDGRFSTPGALSHSRADQGFVMSRLNTLLPVALVAAFSLGACGKVQEKAAEKTMEKAIESSLSKDGTQAKVNMADGGLKVTTTDASGK